MQIFLKRLLLALEVLAWTAFFAFALTFLALRYWVLPNIEGQRDNIVAAISQAVGLPVKIGALETDWAGLRPRLSISEVRVFDRNGREALVLPMVENVVSWRSLVFMDLRLHSLRIDGPKLEVRRDPKGAITVGGIDIGGGDEGRLSDWVLAQNEITIRDAEVTWTDELRGAPPLALTALHFRLANEGDLHAIGLSARPPRHLGPGVELRAELVGRSLKQLAQWNGRVFAELGATNLAGWRAWVDYPFDMRSGEGALRVWASLGEGAVRRATADVALTDVVARMGKDLPPLEITSVRGRLQGRATGKGYEFGVRNLALVSPRSAPMKASGLRVLWEPAEGAQPQKGALEANLIELGPLVQLAEFLPLPADLRRVLAELAPQGNLLDAKLDWTGELPDQAAYTAKMRFAGLAANAWRSIPGFAGLSGSLEASEKKGTLYLASQKSKLDLRGIFPEPRVQLDSLNGEVGWELLSGGGFVVRLPGLSFANPDLAGSAFGNYRWTGEGPGELDLSAQLSRADGRRTAKYLPLSSIMGPETRGWLERAVVAGNVKEARLRIKGDLREFPFTDPAKGQFQIAAKVGAGVLDYVEGWPRISQIEADLLFERGRMEIVGRSGVILGARVGNTRVGIPNLMSKDPRLVLDGSAEGPSADFLKFVQESGLRRMLGGVMDGMSAQGRGRLRLRLELPLNDRARARTSGEFQITNNVLVLGARVPSISAANGRIVFTEDSLNIADLRGTLFGGPVAISGGSKAGVPLAVVARGRGTVEGFSALFDHPWRKRLSGGAAYVATISSLEGRIRTSFETSLEGVASALPEPLGKLPSDVLPLRVEVLPGEGRERVMVTLGPQTGRIVAAEFLRAAAPGGAMRAQRALVMLNPEPGEPPRMPERRGFTVRGALHALDLDRWLLLLRENSGEGSAAGEGGASFELKVGILDALGKRMRNVAMKGVTEGQGWSASMDAAEFAGDLVYRPEGGGRVVARFKHFSVPENSPGAKEGEAARELPAVDLIAESFTHRGRRMGRVEIAARHEGRNWRIDKLAMVNPDSALAGKGLWRTGPGLRTSLADTAASRTALEFKLDVTDVGAFLARMGYPDHVKGGRGRVQGSLDWGGDPVSLDYATLGGKLDMQVDDGQFLEIEPGIGKLLSLMSLQMLPRRIKMDFRDVFSKGFQFDRISSSLAIERGVMTTKDFRMRGPAAEVTMSGLADLNLEAQNLQVRVIPRVDGVASTIAGLINPAAGVAMMIAQKLIKNPLGQLVAYEYNITGTWTNPKVDKGGSAPPAQPNEDRQTTVPGN